jgi:hypothetical protein
MFAMRLANGSISIFSYITQQIVENIPLSGASFVRILSNGLLATQLNSSQINIWNLTTGQLSFYLSKGANDLQELSTGLLATTGTGNFIYLWHSTMGSLIGSISLNTVHYYLQEVSNFLVSSDSGGNIYVWSLLLGTNNYTLASSFICSTGKLVLKSTNTTNLMVTFGSNILQIVDVSAGKCYDSMNPFYNTICATEFIANNTLAVGGNANHVVILRINSNLQFEVVNRIMTTNTVADLKVINANTLLFASSVQNKGVLLVYNLTSNALSSSTITSSVQISNIDTLSLTLRLYFPEPHSYLNVIYLFYSILKTTKPNLS